MKYFKAPLKSFRGVVPGGKNFHEISRFRQQKQVASEAALNNLNITEPNKYVIFYFLVNYEGISQNDINRIIPHSNFPVRIATGCRLPAYRYTDFYTLRISPTLLLNIN